MFKKIQKLVWQVSEVTCDMCNQTCLKEHGSNEYGTIKADWGYFSSLDGVSEECHLCESCFSKVRKFIQEQGGTMRTSENLPYTRDT